MYSVSLSTFSTLAPELSTRLLSMRNVLAIYLLLYHLSTSVHCCLCSVSRHRKLFVHLLEKGCSMKTVMWIRYLHASHFVCCLFQHPTTAIPHYLGCFLLLCYTQSTVKDFQGQASSTGKLAVSSEGLSTKGYVGRFTVPGGVLFECDCCF